MSALLVLPEPQALIDLSPIASQPSNVIEPEQEQSLVPPVPESIEDTGLAQSAIEQLALKFLYFRGEMMGRDLATAMGFKFSLIERLIEDLKRQYIIQVKRSLGMGNSSAVIALTETGRTTTREYLENNQYTGPAPVPLFQYTWFARHQRREPGWLTQEAFKHAYPNILSPQTLLPQI